MNEHLASSRMFRVMLALLVFGCNNAFWTPERYATHPVRALFPFDARATLHSQPDATT